MFHIASSQHSTIIVAVSSSVTTHSITNLTQDDETADKSVVENSIHEILSSILDHTEIISEVVILMICNRARRLQTGGGPIIEHMLIVLDISTTNGSSLLPKLKETMGKKVSDGGLSEEIKKHALEDGVDLPNDMSIVSAPPIEGSFMNMADPMFSFKVPVKLSLIASCFIL